MKPPPLPALKKAQAKASDKPTFNLKNNTPKPKSRERENDKPQSSSPSQRQNSGSLNSILPVCSNRDDHNYDRGRSRSRDKEHQWYS